MPTIRIDQEIYEWLQAQAKAFEDTPNSVLRRVANLDSAPASDPDPKSVIHREKQKRTASGRQLVVQENLVVSQAFYHWEGNFYNVAHKFPVALFDRFGYVIIDSKAEYLNHPKISVGERANIPDGIDSFPDYKKMSRPAF